MERDSVGLQRTSSVAVGGVIALGSSVAPHIVQLMVNPEPT
jgi:hypothetical protein